MKEVETAKKKVGGY